MTTEAGVAAGSRAVLIGVSAYEYAEFPSIRAARNSLEAMQSLLTDPTLCGWPAELVTVIANPVSATALADRIADLAEATTGVLLLYYVGHGALSARGELCLTATATRPNRPKITGLPWETVAEVLRSCPARTRLVILDCCFAGQAIEALGADSGEDLADITHVDGVYTLAATTRNRMAHVPPPDQQDIACTSFTGELRDLIRTGIPGKPSHLTFSDIYPELRQRLQAKGLPVPSQRGTDTAHQFPFAANMATGSGPAVQTIEADHADVQHTLGTLREGHFADRYRGAVEQLGSVNLEVRIGGIYALEAIAVEFPRNHPTVMEVLVTFIREHSRRRRLPPDLDNAEQEQWPLPDVQIALTVVGRREAKHDIRPINLSRVDLTGADLSSADLAHANLSYANLSGADFSRANLSDADLSYANLSHAYGSYSDLTGARLTRVNLTGARLFDATLTGARLYSASLARTDLAFARFDQADLTEADFTQAHLTGAQWPQGTSIPDGWGVDPELPGRLKRTKPTVSGM